MTRTLRIRKLGMAIRDYRGSYVPCSEPRKWIRHPQPSAAERIRKWLAELGVTDLDAAMKAVDGFSTIGDMHKWLDENVPVTRRQG